tara:strand:+ start:10629 stop:11459 length:831 start_codon:yes stop_codon:yes gene_type:complete
MKSTEDIIGRYVRVDGTRVHYDELGEGTPLVLIHTLYACSLEWTRIMPLLAASGFHCVALDLPGNSRSYPPNWKPLSDPREYGDFIARFIQTLFGDQKVVIAGTSIGGNLAIDLTLRHSSLVAAAIAMEGGVWTPTVMPLAPFANPASLPSWPEWLERCALESLNPNVDPEVREELKWQHRFTGHRSGLLQANCWTNQDLRDVAGPVSCPLLVINGEYDFYLPQALMELTKELIPNCETRTLPDIGHYPMCEDPELITTIIEEFVRRHQLKAKPLS